MISQKIFNRLEEVDEVEVRPADFKDEEPISKLFQSTSDEEAEDRMTRINRMLEEPNAKTFVALNQENEIVGWTQAKIAFSLSVAEAHIKRGNGFLCCLGKKLQ